jgi:hypothetical protein
MDASGTSGIYALFGSLVGAGAVVAGQVITPAAISNRETDARLRRDRRIRKIFGTRVRKLAFNCAFLADSPELAHVLLPWCNDALDPLVHDFNNDDLLISLEPATIGAFGQYLTKIQNFVLVGSISLERNQKRIGDGVDLDEKGKLDITNVSGALDEANLLLKALSETPYTGI